MNTYKNVSTELKAFFSNNAIFKILLPLDFIILFVSVGLLVLNCFVNVGGLVYALAYYAMFLGLVLTYANFNQKFLFLGLVIYGGVEGFYFLKYALFQTYKFADYFSLVSCVIFLLLSYKVFRTSNKILDK